MERPSDTLEKTRLWKTTLAAQPGSDPHSIQRDHLRVAFLSMRKRAAQIAAEIARDQPELTVHDVTHLDALWEMADIVMAPSDTLTPIEAFILGGAFLIHDLGNGLAAYPRGEADLRQSTKWCDVIGTLIRRETGRAPTEQELQHPAHETLRKARQILLRELHAEQAKKLPIEAWRGKEDQPLYLISDDDLREWTGETIGQIARSHWLNVSDLLGEFKTVLPAPSGYPRAWESDPLRLACLMRIADAIHIDSRRAPQFLRILRRPQEDSDRHWNFQQKMRPPRLSGDRLEFTSVSFSAREAKAWWLCFEYLQMIARELHQVDALLADTNRKPLAAKTVAGIEDPARFADFVRPAGWMPSDARIHVSDVIGLVEKLGGYQLYGPSKDIPIPLRELIQNAADAIRARRALEPEQNGWGKIVVKMGRDSDGPWLEVEDNGIGMRPNVLTGALLDFGSSYWRSNDVRRDWPGLLTSAFDPCGQYGIGFFSVFMWAHKIRVTSRPYDKAMSDTHLLEFNSGPRERPLVREAERNEWLREGGTCIRIWLKAKIEELAANDRSMEDRCTHLCPALDIDLFVQEEGKTPVRVIEASDWLTIPPEQLLRRICISKDELMTQAFEERMRQYAPLVEVIRDPDGTPIGRACLHNDSITPSGLITVGGLGAQYIRGIAGVLTGKSENASRKLATPIIAASAFGEWLSRQARKMNATRFFPANDYHEYIYAHRAAEFVTTCGGNPGPLAIAYYQGKRVSADDIAKMADLGDEVLLVFDGTYAHGDRIKNIHLASDSRQSDGPNAAINTNVILSSGGSHEVLLGEDTRDRWPPEEELPHYRRDLMYVVALAVAKAWSVSVEDIYDPKKGAEMCEVGVVAGEPVRAHARVLRRPLR